MIWTNPDHSIAFDAQTVKWSDTSISNSSGFYAVKFYYATGNINEAYVFIRYYSGIGTAYGTILLPFAMQLTCRSITINSTGFVFGSGRYNDYGKAAATNNANCIPVQIIRIL